MRSLSRSNGRGVRGDAAVALLADTLVAEGGKPALIVLHLMLRLDSSRKRTLIRQILKDAQNLDALYLVEGIEASWLEWGDLTKQQDAIGTAFQGCGKRRTREAKCRPSTGNDRFSCHCGNGGKN